jgi:phosphate starvation-inducible PhoH-like protein
MGKQACELASGALCCRQLERDRLAPGCCPHGLRIERPRGPLLGAQQHVIREAGEAGERAAARTALGRHRLAELPAIAGTLREIRHSVHITHYPAYRATVGLLRGGAQVDEYPGGVAAQSSAQRKELEISNEAAKALAGASDATLRELERNLDARVTLRGNHVILEGDDEAILAATAVISEIVALSDRGAPPDPESIERITGGIARRESASALHDDLVWKGRVRVAPKTAGQRAYVQAIRENTVTFGIGPAGTGKTFLAVALAASALAERRVQRILLTRPAVEAGERLGFLPGDLMAKVDPYLRPLFDALHDMLGAEKVASYLEKGQIEVAPLAFMRGRTLNDSFIIVDEAQNTTREQMKMVLTRLGFGSRMVITGDTTQIDLPRGTRSGLISAARILEGVDDIGMITFDSQDVIRHRLVKKIVDAYDADDVDRERQAAQRRAERASD